MALTGTQIFERRAVDQENVHPSIIVVIEDSDTAAHRFHDVAFFKAAAGEMKINPCGVSDICELRGGRRGCRCVPSGRSFALARLLLRRMECGGGRRQEKKADNPSCYSHTDVWGDHQWTRPVAIPPDCR